MDGDNYIGYASVGKSSVMSLDEFLAAVAAAAANHEPYDLTEQIIVDRNVDLGEYGWVRIRSGAGTSYSIAGYYYPGNTVTITEQKTVGATKWGKTDKGWVSMDYVQLDSTSSGMTDSSKTTMTIIADYLNIRENPGTSGTRIVGYLTYGAKVEVLETKMVGSTKWGRIANGWISLDYAK